MRRAILVVFVATLGFTAPASAQHVQAHDDDQRSCSISDTADECFNEHFNLGRKLEGTLLDTWRGDFEGANWKQDDNCQKVKTKLLELFDMAEAAVGGKTAELYFATPKDTATYWSNGSYYDGLNNGTEYLVVINDTFPEWKQWDIFLHEAAHHAGYEHNGGFTTGDAEDCATEGEEDPNGGGNNEDDPDDPGETCTTTTEWQVRWRPCHSWSGGSLPDLTVCFEKIRVPVQVTICD